MDLPILFEGQHSAGIDLLTLINDILDLSKIESGTVTIDIGELLVENLEEHINRTFRHVAEAKNLAFEIELDDNLPTTMQTDTKRLQQVLKNLLSNAFKFTERGHVGLTMKLASEGWNSENETLNRASSVIAFAVKDTGIGIASDKQQIIFEPFLQADGSTNRRFGGTGLGLAISREIARLLGGEIRLVSQPGEGSTFTLYLPQNYVAPRWVRKGTAGAPELGTGRTELVTRKTPEPLAPETHVPDDRDNIVAGDRVMLIVEDDTAFATFLLEMARGNGFKGVVTGRGYPEAIFFPSLLCRIQWPE